mmetsp:Transcript_6895/g.16899  ORF Transcript_6895/g.16899 Transcript_6895/m.16899 type:complete len:253 (+) Transcript_6895:951-1709(+)
MRFILNTRCIPSLTTEVIGDVVQSLRVDTIIEVTDTTAGSHLHASFSERIYQSKLDVIDVAVFQAFELSVNVAFLVRDYLEPSSVDVRLSRFVRIDRGHELRERLFGIVAELLRPFPRRNRVIRVVFGVVGRHEAIRSRTAMLQALVLLADDVHPLRNTQILRFGSPSFRTIVVLRGYLVLEGAGTPGGGRREERKSRKPGFENLTARIASAIRRKKIRLPPLRQRVGRVDANQREQGPNAYAVFLLSHAKV